MRASVLFPGPNWLRTNLWEAWRWRPDEYAKTVPRQTPYPSLDQLEQIMAERGVELEWTPLEEVADTVVRGIRAEQFWMLPPSDDDRRVDPGARRVDARARATRPTSASGRNRRSEHRSLHGHLGRRSRGRVGPGVPRVPRVALARRVRRVGADLQQPVRGPRRIERLPQLGLRRARSPSSRPTASSPRCCSRTRSRRSSRRARS